MTTRVLITVDTELTNRHFARGAGWQENLARSFDPAGVGVPFQLEALREHGLKACFFVDPMPALRYGIEPVRRMVEPILAAGQEVQLHLHPFWLSDPDAPEEERVYELNALSAETQLALIADARNLLIEAGAPSPVAFRAGSYAANADTLDALDALGFSFDSSHNGGHHPQPSNLPFNPAMIDPVVWRGVTEIPVTQIAAAGGGLRHLQLCAVSSLEVEAALLHAVANAHPVVTLVSHSFELATRNGRSANAVYRDRFQRLCDFLARRAEQLPTAHFTSLETLKVSEPAQPLPPDPLREARRMMEQAWADGRYEYSARIAVAVSGSAAAAAGAGALALLGEL